MLVGDIILGARVRINDLPRTIAAPTGLTISAAPGIGATLPAGTYYAKGTFFNQWGETIATSEFGPFVLAPGDGLTVSGSFIPGATGIKVYYGIGQGAENQWYSIITSLPLSFGAPGQAGIPPTRNTSFYPDVDGQRVSAYTLYQWLNDALDMATNICDGIPDMTGLATINTQGMYEIIGQWSHFDHGWWDGYQIKLTGRDILFYRNVVPGFVSVGVLQQISNRIILELQPQPNRSGATTTASNTIALTDKTIQLTDVSGFKLPFGMAVIGTPPDPSMCEVVSFSTINGSTLTGVVRGMGGTVQQAWQTGTPVAEGNLRLSGRRSFVAPDYVPGMAISTLSVPSGWSKPLQDFMVSRFREAEGNVQEANRLMQAFEQTIRSTLMGNSLVAGPRQVGGSDGLDVWPTRGPFGVIVP